MQKKESIAQHDEINVTKDTVSQGQRKSFIKKIVSNKFTFIGGIILSLFILIVIFASFIAPYDPYELSVSNRYLAPSEQHFFGTDKFGRDIFSRVLYGCRLSLFIGFTVVLISSSLGLILGVLSAYYRKLDRLLVLLYDGLMAFPDIILALALMAALGASIRNIIIAFSSVFIPYVARIVRAKALMVMGQPYIEAMKVLGAKPGRIICFHVVPNCIPEVIVYTVLNFALAILGEAGLSFLGVGAPLSTPSLGNIIVAGRNVLLEAWWMVIFPGAALTLLVMGFYLFGDGLGDLLDSDTNKISK